MAGFDVVQIGARIQIDWVMTEYSKILDRRACGACNAYKTVRKCVMRRCVIMRQFKGGGLVVQHQPSP